MKHAQKNVRSVVLTEQGKTRLEIAINSAQDEEKFGKRFTWAELEDRCHLSEKTIRKIRVSSEPVDQSSLETLFSAFDLSLRASDYGHSEVPTTDSTSGAKVDWLEAQDASIFFGRRDEIAKLQEWICKDKCRLIALLGMGGIGKTALASKVGEHNQGEFDYVMWRSLREAPPLEKILLDSIQFFSAQTELILPDSVSEAVNRIVHYFRKSRCLLILDNAESIMAGGQQVGAYREGYEGYSKLLQRIGESEHQSCLIITSREKPKEIARMEGRKRPVRTLSLQGLTEVAGQEIFDEEELDIEDQQLGEIFKKYQGNPLALKIAASNIQEIYGGDVQRFLENGSFLFGDIQEILKEQFERLSPAGQSVLYWLAIYREPVQLATLEHDWLKPTSKHTLQAVLESLQRRSLIENTRSGFTLQNVVMEYVTSQLLSTIREELATQKLAIFNSHALIQATAKNYVRETQKTLIVDPLLSQLNYLNDFLETSLRLIKSQIELAHGYAAGNLLNLLIASNKKISNPDFSGLKLRFAYLENTRGMRFNFINSTFISSIFLNQFEPIPSTTFSPDGSLLVAGGSSGDIYSWKVPDGELSGRLQAHQAQITVVKFSPDGQVLASGSSDGMIKLWRLEHHQCLMALRGDPISVRSLTFSPDGLILASGGGDGCVHLWNAQTGEKLHRFEENQHSAWICSIAFSPDGQTLASGSIDQTVQFWHIEQQQHWYEFDIHGNSVLSVTFSPDGQLLAVGCSDGNICLWDIQKRQLVSTLSGHTAAVTSVAFAPNNKTLASGSADKTIRLWNLDSGECIHSFQGHTAFVHAISFSPDGQQLASGSEDATVQIWNVQQRQHLHTFKGYSYAVNDIQLSGDGRLLASSHEDGTVRLWDMQQHQWLHCFQGHKAFVSSLAFSPDGNFLVSSGEDTTIRIWQLQQRQCLQTLRGHRACVRSVAFFPGGHFLASGSSDASIRLWDMAQLHCVHAFEGHTGEIRQIAVSADGLMLASASQDGTIRLWNTLTRACLKVLHGHRSTVMDVAFSPDGRLLASSSSDNTARLWSLESFHCLRVYQGHNAFLRSVVFSGDGQTIATGSADGMIRLWPVNQSECLQTFRGHTSVNPVIFSLDNQLLISGGSVGDGTIRFWDINTGQCTETIRAPGPYEGMEITGAKGLTSAQRSSLRALGAIDRNFDNCSIS